MPTFFTFFATTRELLKVCSTNQSESKQPNNHSGSGVMAWQDIATQQRLKLITYS